MTKKRELNYLKILVYYLILLAIWSFRELLLESFIRSNLGDLGAELVGEFIKLAVWALPAALLVLYYKSEMYVTLRGMFTTKVDILLYLLIFFGFLAVNLVGSLINEGKIVPTFPEPISSMIGTVLLVGITEEMVFRGFLQNALVQKMESTYALITSSLMFVVIHFPIWIYKGIFTGLFQVLGNCVSIFCLSLVFGWTFMKSRNIIVPICLHMSWNLIVILFR